MHNLLIHPLEYPVLVYIYKHFILANTRFISVTKIKLPHSIADQDGKNVRNQKLLKYQMSKHLQMQSSRKWYAEISN